MPQEGDCKHPLLFESVLFLVLSCPFCAFLLLDSHLETAVVASGDVQGSLLPEQQMQGFSSKTKQQYEPFTNFPILRRTWNSIFRFDPRFDCSSLYITN